MPQKTCANRFVSLSFADSDWRPTAARPIPGLRLDGAVALASTRRDRPGTLVAGVAPDAQGAGLLPSKFKQPWNGHAVATVSEGTGELHLDGRGAVHNVSEERAG